MSLFPGSVLHRREEPKRKSASADAAHRDAQKKGAKPPRWIIAAEIMENLKVAMEEMEGLQRAVSGV